MFRTFRHLWGLFSQHFSGVLTARTMTLPAILGLAFSFGIAFINSTCSKRPGSGIKSRQMRAGAAGPRGGGGGERGDQPEKQHQGRRSGRSMKCCRRRRRRIWESIWSSRRRRRRIRTLNRRCSEGEGRSVSRMLLDITQTIFLM